MKSKIILGLSTGFLFLTSCSDSTSSAPLTAPEGFENPTNYSAELSKEVITADLKELASLQNVDLNMSPSMPSLGRVAKAAKLLGPVSVESEECEELSTKEEFGTQGSGEYSYEETKFTKGGKPVTSCSFDANSSSFSFDLYTKTIEEYGSTLSNYETMGSMSVNVNQTTGSMAMSVNSTFNGTTLYDTTDIKQWGTLSMEAKFSEAGSSMKMDMEMNLHFLADKYRCTVDFSVDFDMNDLDEATGNSEATLVNSCDLTHGGTSVGKIEFDENGTTVYDLEGNEIPAK